MKLRNNILNILLKLGVSKTYIETSYIYMYSFFKRCKKPLYKAINTYLYFLGKRSKIEYELRKILFSGREKFGDNTFYQSYPPLGITGERDSSLRSTNYMFSKYLKPNDKILDIGGNVGFFSLFISGKVQHIDIIEYSKTAVKIGKLLQEYENITNVKLFQSSFESFSTPKKYSVIFSFAIHKWVDMSFREYIEKVVGFLENDGIIFIESQNLEIDPFEKNISLIQDILVILETIKIIEKNGYNRILCICRKK